MNVCSRCGKGLSGDDLLEECPECGSKFFKFVNTKKIKETQCLEKEEKGNLPSDNEVSIDEDSVESVKIEDTGIYEVNLPHILEGKGDVYSDNEGKYAIDINTFLKKSRKDHEEKKYAIDINTFLKKSRKD